jgi:hypothetical protein
LLLNVGTLLQGYTASILRDTLYNHHYENVKPYSCGMVITHGRKKDKGKWKEEENK